MSRRYLANSLRQRYHWQAPGIGFKVYDTADKLPGLSVGQFFDFVTTFSFGFLKILRIKRTSILGLYFFEIFRNQRTCCSGFFFLLIQNQKNLCLQAFEKKFEEPRVLWNRYQQFRVGSSTGSLDFSEPWLLVKNRFFDFLKNSSSWCEGSLIPKLNLSVLSLEKQRTVQHWFFQFFWFKKLKSISYTYFVADLMSVVALAGQHDELLLLEVARTSLCKWHWTHFHSQWVGQSIIKWVLEVFHIWTGWQANLWMTQT